MRFGSMHVLQVIMESLEIISNYIISSRLNYNNHYLNDFNMYYANKNTIFEAYA